MSPYAAAQLEEIIGRTNAAYLEVNWLESTVFLNRGGKFEAWVLPPEAQMAPAFGVSVADFDGDGKQDLFMSQNFFGSQNETPRGDAGLGLVLMGKGNGEFAALTASASGIRIWGEQRGCAVADFDGDGRVDLAVAQNAGATKLFRNVGGKPGVRARP